MLLKDLTVVSTLNLKLDITTKTGTSLFSIRKHLQETKDRLVIKNTMPVQSV